MDSALVPMSVNGMTRIVSIPTNGGGKDSLRYVEEQNRCAEAGKRRLYYGGEQYDAENQATADTLGLKSTERLAEHQRKHAYSTQLGECVDFVADRIGQGFEVLANDAAVQVVIDACVSASETISAENEVGAIQVITDDPLRDALIAGDTPVHIRWDPIEMTAYLEFWEAEHVEFVWEGTRDLKEVVLREVVWRTDDVGQERQVTERQVYDVEWNEMGVLEARRQMFWDDEEAPRETEWLGMGAIPWRLLRADAKGLRSLRGQSLISGQAMETADRYNAVEHVGWLIARYNSHGNLAVVGDGASLKLEADGRVSKDVADVLTFPGGTALQVLTLPTDPKMIEHQHDVLANALYAAFGLTRVEPDTLQGLGAVSGYALEILNQKTEGTFRRIRRHWRKDWVSLLNGMLDVVAWKRDAPYGLMNLSTGEFAPMDPAEMQAVDLPPDMSVVPVQAWWLIDPQTVFGNRQIEVKMGSGYVVDAVMVRDDFTAGLVSRQDALRQRGRTEPEIKAIEKEIADAAPVVPEIGLTGVGLGGATRNGVVPPAGTKSGSTVAVVAAPKN